jgi:RimJ/RimL family protein N-acetyltransferase
MLRPGYPLLTARLLLRPFRDDDLDALSVIDGDPAITRYLYWGPRSRAEVRASLARRKKMTAIDKEGDAIRLAVVLRDAATLVGDVSLQYRSREHRQGEIGFVLHPDHHGKGYATEAATVLLRLGFEELDLHRIVGRCDPRNTASAHLMERLGMVREAHLRENEFIKGEWCDELIFAMLDAEWHARPTAVDRAPGAGATPARPAPSGGARGSRRRP